jgi:hypothetical protein
MSTRPSGFLPDGGEDLHRDSGAKITKRAQTGTRIARIFHAVVVERPAPVEIRVGDRHRGSCVGQRVGVPLRRPFIGATIQRLALLRLIKFFSRAWNPILIAAWFGIGEIETLLKTVRLNPAELSPQFLIAKADWLKLRFESSRH